MGLANLGQLEASIATWATRTDLTATIPDFVAWAQQEIGRRLRSQFNMARADISVSAEFAAVPADFRAINTFRLDVTPRVQLGLTSPAGIENLIANSGTPTYPSAVAVEGPEFHFGPTFSTATTGKLLYYVEPAAMSNPTDANPVLLKYPYLYLYGALEALFRYLEDDNNADRYGGLFGALIESINGLEMKDAMSGPLTPATASGAVV